MGLLITVPPLSADMAWFSALKSRNAEQVQKALEPGYLNPESSHRYNYAVVLFENSKLPDLAYRYVKQSVVFNPDDFTSWLQLYHTTNSTVSDKEVALKNLKRLDPLNSNVTAIDQ